MKIGELSRRSGISQRMIRYYEERGLLSPERSDSNYRNYVQDDVCRLRRIQILQEAGLTLKVIRNLMPCVSGEPIQFEACPLVIKTLHDEKLKMDRQIQNLSESRTLLESYLQDTGQRADKMAAIASA